MILNVRHLMLAGVFAAASLLDIIVGEYRKLLGYALGRQTMLSDRALLMQMQAALRGNGGRFSAAVLEVVGSRQFLNRRNESAAGNP